MAIHPAGMLIPAGLIDIGGYRRRRWRLPLFQLQVLEGKARGPQGAQQLMAAIAKG
jgi:hypothetical protein